jgi:hypothetical protein
MPSSAHTQLFKQFTRVMERLDSGSLTAEQIRQSLQQLIESPHSNSLSLLGVDKTTLRLLLNAGVVSISNLAKYEESAVVQMLVEDDDGYPMSHEKAVETAERFASLRHRLEDLGLSFKGPRLTVQELIQSNL